MTTDPNLAQQFNSIRCPRCGNVGTHGEGGHEYCSTCGGDMDALRGTAREQPDYKAFGREVATILPLYAAVKWKHLSDLAFDLERAARQFGIPLSPTKED